MNKCTKKSDVGVLKNVLQKLYDLLKGLKNERIYYNISIKDKKRSH